MKDLLMQTANPHYALITGALGGIGRVLVQAFAANGYYALFTSTSPANTIFSGAHHASSR